MSTVLLIPKSVKKTTVAITKGQSELKSDMKNVKTSQNAIETMLTDISRHLESLESKSEALDTVFNYCTITEESAEWLEKQQRTIASLSDDLEDRSRRNNLFFYGIPDSR